MNVQELIERLEGLDPEAEVLIAQQPSWPLQTTVRGVATSEDIAGETACEDHGDFNCDECAIEPVVYLVEGNQPDDPYAPRAAWDVAR